MLLQLNKRVRTKIEEAYHSLGHLLRPTYPNKMNKTESGTVLHTMYTRMKETLPILLIFFFAPVPLQLSMIYYF